MTAFVVRVYRDGTQISQTFSTSTTLTDFTVDEPTAGSHTYKISVGISPQDSIGYTGNVGFTRIIASLLKK